MNKISIIGAGTWGTALAAAIASKGAPVTLWARNAALADEINAAHENKPYLAGIALPSHLTATSNLKNALESDILLLVTPAQAMRETLSIMKPYIRENHILVLCAKGIEIETGKLMSDVAQEILPQTRKSVLTGPNFAHEIAAGKPAATTLACADENLAKTLQNAIATPYFRAYITTDMTGAQIAGALKNVVAIACGVAHGPNMGESARASLVTRGMAEIARLGLAMGARTETFLGLSGMGDMMLTCSSEKSRNFSFGQELGHGKTPAEIMKNRRNVTEGVHTARAAINLAQLHNIALPVCEAVHNCVNLGVGLDETVRALLNRPLGYEF